MGKVLRRVRDKAQIASGRSLIAIWTLKAVLARDQKEERRAEEKAFTISESTCHHKQTLAV